MPYWDTRDDEQAGPPSGYRDASCVSVSKSFVSPRPCETMDLAAARTERALRDTLCGSSVAGYCQPRRRRILIPARRRRLATVWGSRSCWLAICASEWPSVYASGGRCERVIIPLLGDTPALRIPAVEVSHHGGAADAEAFGKLHDRRAGVVAVDERRRRRRRGVAVVCGAVPCVGESRCRVGIAARCSAPARGLNSVPMRRAAAVRGVFGWFLDCPRAVPRGRWCRQPWWRQGSQRLVGV